MVAFGGLLLSENSGRLPHFAGVLACIASMTVAPQRCAISNIVLDTKDYSKNKPDFFQLNR